MGNLFTMPISKRSSSKHRQRDKSHIASHVPGDGPLTGRRAAPARSQPRALRAQPPLQDRRDARKTARLRNCIRADVLGRGQCRRTNHACLAAPNDAQTCARASVSRKCRKRDTGGKHTCLKIGETRRAREELEREKRKKRTREKSSLSGAQLESGNARPDAETSGGFLRSLCQVAREDRA